MLNFLKKLFEKESNNLISGLKMDHKKLFELYTKIEESIKKEDFESTKGFFKEFLLEYNKHILLEDTKLYSQLKESYKDQNQILSAINIIENDMNSITECIHCFEKTFQDINKENKQAFLEELHYIGKVLSQRIELEEERLYPLYNEDDK